MSGSVTRLTLLHQAKEPVYTFASSSSDADKFYGTCVYQDMLVSTKEPLPKEEAKEQLASLMCARIDADVQKQILKPVATVLPVIANGRVHEPRARAKIFQTTRSGVKARVVGGGGTVMLNGPVFGDLKGLRETMVHIYVDKSASMPMTGEERVKETTNGKKAAKSKPKQAPIPDTNSAPEEAGGSKDGAGDKENGTEGVNKDG